VWKEAFFYEKQGYEVVILSMWQSDDLLEKDWKILKGHAISYKAYLNLLPGGMNKIDRLYYRLKKKLAGELQRLFKIGTASAISYAPGLMLKKALKEDADLYAAHLECSFYAGKQLLKAGKKVCFDFEDWYSRDYLVPAKPVRFLKSLEKFALDKGLFCTATSKAMADALKDAYGINKEIAVIYNGFSINESVERKGTQQNHNDKAYTKLIWFSRTIGPGRGIEDLLKALALYGQPVELHVLGKMKKGFKEVLETGFKGLKKHTLVIHDFVPHYRLPAFIGQFDIGLAIEENINDNKMLTVSNKMLQYLQAGIPVIASNTKGQQEVAAYFPGTVRVIDIEKPGVLGEAIDSLAKKSNRYKEEQVDTFNKIFSWEAQESKLTDLLQKHLCIST
jgi:glycosyltransferase involved in cell wall biosynthesis